ncbi:MAG TPA: hypothetical protein VFK29_02530 [Rhodanobacteraceae bacterium]|jgi:hypothetical protein|nr:hypothetical protein [Rhodanobacteraceae bacterium]
MDQPRRVDDSADKLPKHTTPTWEVELLISGVAVFAMMQLPGWLIGLGLYLRPRFDEGWRGALFTLSAYLVGAAVILAATFALHLLLRAYWIALVGMHSVYPDGIRWERLRIGPIEREVMQRRDGDFAAMIERADNRASVLFAMGVALAATLLAITAEIVILFSAGLAIALALHADIEPDRILIICIVVLVAPMALLHLFDRKFGAHVRQGSLLRRSAAAMFNLYARLGFANRGGVLAMLASHHGRRRVQLLATVAMAVCLLGAILAQETMRHPELFGNYAGFPRLDGANGNVVDAANYADLRDPLRSRVAPFIQATEVDGNYVRLTVPYVPGEDAAAMQRHCPESTAEADDDARAAAMLRCLAALHPVTLDGKPLADLRYDAGSDARTERPALVAMIDVRKLPPGRHELAVARPAAGIENDQPAPAEPWIIPFWR